MTNQTLEQKAVEIITNLQNLAEPAMQLTLQAVQVSAIVDLAIGVLMATAFAVTSVKYVPRYMAWRRESKYDEDIAVFVVGAFGALALLFFIVCISATLLDSGNWVAAFRPDLALAKALVSKAI